MAVELEINSNKAFVEPGPSLFECAESVGVRVPTSCRKQGKCRECLVEIEEGADLLSPPSDEEKHLKGRFRLSCRARIVAEQGSLRCHTLRRGAMRIEDKALGLPSRARLIGLDPAVIREGDRVLLDGVEISRQAGALHGLALDLGTTTVVVRLVDLETGKTEATQAFENPQRFAGSDIMARIQYDSENRGRLLQRVLVGYINHVIEALPCESEEIFEVVVAANSTMRDLFFGLDVHALGQRPYRSIVENEFRRGEREDTHWSVKARKLRLNTHPDARVYGLPLIGSHVGADASACLLAVDMVREEEIIAVMDIGTNTELILGNRSRAIAASCPAGPAFEGGELSCGMPGLEGAVERVLLRDSGEVDLDVIGDEKPVGICGSGLVSLLGELLRTQRINQFGRLSDFSDRFFLDDQKSLWMSENDVSLLAQAKGANVAGLRLVCSNLGVRFDQIQKLYLAGGFARHIDLEAARSIGLLPDLPDDKVIQIGNASIEGATVALLSASRRRELESFVKTVQHLELEQDPAFFDCFVEGCQFIPVRDA